MATQGHLQGVRSGDSSVTGSPAPTAVAPSSSIPNKNTPKKAKMNIVSGPPKDAKARPLNSWMAFRSYYHGMFSGVQQKHASTYLNILWQQDPFKAKWAVLAKTYTLIKDKVGKRMAPLDTFLQLTCPKMGIIAVGDYLKMLDWTVTSENGVLSVTRTDQPSLDTFDRAIVCCSMTHIDLLQYVIDSGYLDGVENVTSDIQHSNTHLLATAAYLAPIQAKKAFLTDVQKDPKAIAAAIIGIDINHKFLEISSGPNSERLIAAGPPYFGNVLPMQPPAPLSLPQPPRPMIGRYPWTGSMSELYQPSEIVLDLDSMIANDEWMVTDISNPLALDNYLQNVGGFSPEELNSGQLGDPTNMVYQFNDSF